jgi:hypothetical protein
MFMRYLLKVFVLMLPFSVAGQLDPDKTNGLILPYWTSSDLVMTNGETVSGEIQFNLIDKPTFIQLRIDGNLFEVPASAIKEFSFFDSTAARTRTFGGIYHRRQRGIVLMEYRGQNSNYAVVWHRFSKTVWHDELGGQPSIHLTGRPDPLQRATSKPSTSLRDEKYLYDRRSGELIPLSFESLMKICASRQREVKTYIRERELKIETVKSYMDVLNYFATLIEN